MRFFLFALTVGCATPVEGALPEGIYGSPDIGLRVDSTGDAVFERSCGRGDLGVVSATDGELAADFEWVVTGGDPVEDTAAPTGTPATVDATVTDATIVGTIESGGETQDLSLRFGEEPTYFECP